MEKRFLICIAFACILCINLHAQVFVIDRGTNTTLTFDNIKSAVDALEDNDRLYIPSGVHNLGNYNWTQYNESKEETETLASKAVAIEKKVAIYGGGYLGENASSFTNGTIILTQKASGSYITGLSFYDLRLDNVSNLNISRCIITNYLIGYGYGGNNSLQECDVYRTSQSFSINNRIGINATRCIFRSSHQIFTNSTINNCLFLDYSSSSWVFEYSTISNNIFIIDKTKTAASASLNGSCPGNIFKKNLFVGGELTGNISNSTLIDNIIKQPYTETFVNGELGNYQLKDESPAKNAGTDGTDIGIYGTSSPFNDNRMPALPYFKVKVIGTETDATGKLPVEIVIEAQD